MDIISVLKNIAGGLATATTLVYVSGYLTLRARAFALGTDPSFTLAYDGYVFAGFRFLFISLIILLILSPLIFAARFVALWLREHIPATVFDSGQWLLLILLALCTLLAMVKVLSVNGVLLQENGGANSLMEEAVMGGQVGAVMVFIFASYFVATLSILWLAARLPAENGPFSWVLAVVVSLQLFLLPILNGALYADRKVRVLAATPSAVTGLLEPLGIVDRAGDHVTLLGVNGQHERRLVTLKLDALSGIPIKEIVSLEKFAQNELVHAAKKDRESAPEIVKNTAPSAKAESSKGFFERLAGSLHVAFENIGSLGDTVVESGQIWSVEFDASGKPADPGKVSAAGNFSWPVVGPGSHTIYAIQQDRMVKLGDDGRSVTEVDGQAQWIKLFGVTEQGDILGMIYEDGESILATLHADRKITRSLAPKSDEEKARKAFLAQENRAYAGKRTLYVARSSRGGRGFDVFYKKGEDEAVNLSHCGADSCGQPSLSPDFRRVLFVRKPY